MQTIAEFVSNGIESTSDLIAALQLALQLEFSTIPPYLCAQWSIDPVDDRDRVSRMLEDIVVQEMYHFAQVGNMLASIGAEPDFLRADFLVKYPTPRLPGNIELKKPVDLLPLSIDQLSVFEDIEHPQFKPIGPDAALALDLPAPASIGEFYDTIASGFKSANPTFVQGAQSVQFAGEVEQIKSLDDAFKAIERIKDEGEGTAQSPDQIIGEDANIAHYYKFKQIRIGRKFSLLNGSWDFHGPAIHFPKIFPFARSSDSNSSAAFSLQLKSLVTSLHSSWTTGGEPDIGAMVQLRTLGTKLITSGITPEFVWSADSSM